VAKDEGVSATLNRPENRAGWRSILEFTDHVDAVVVWKIDRLARRVLDFLQADAAMQARGAGIVAVEQAIDMTTAEGRGFAQMLAVFGEMEAAAISARVKAAREDLIRSGRVVGGTVPYGWQSVSNPDGPGLVLAQDPSRIEFVRGMAARVLAGETVYAVTRWLDEVGAPLPRASQGRRTSGKWAYSTVERLLRSPVLAGMTPYSPGRPRHDRRDPTRVLRDETGLPVIDESVAVLTTSEHRQLLARLDARDSPQARPRASKESTSPLLSRLVDCGDCRQLMHRGTTQGRPSLSCPRCHQTISRLEEYVVGRFLRERGDRVAVEFIDEPTDETEALEDLEAAISDISIMLTRDDADTATLVARLEDLKRMRHDARAAQPFANFPKVQILAGTVREAWEIAETVTERRKILQGQIHSLRIVRGRVGRGFDPNRVQIDWRE
jgi:site-specific DNA recombinase